LFGVEEEGAEDFEVAGGVELLEFDVVDLVGGVGEVGVDLDEVHVADHEEWRVFEVIALEE
jgi:hypothetical protein